MRLYKEEDEDDDEEVTSTHTDLVQLEENTR